MTEPGRILVIVAHPDDVDFGTAGSVAVWTDAGIEVVYCVVTDGDAGGYGRGIPREEMARVRREEQEAAARIVGVNEVIFAGYPDGQVMPTLELRRDLSRVIRKVRPDRVVAPSPERNFQRIYASHPDHLAVGEAALCAVYPDARNGYAHPELLAEGLEPHTVPEVWIMSTRAPNRYVDITSTIDRKIKALLCHTSQIADPDGIEQRIRAWGRVIAGEAGLPEDAYAEGYLVIETG